MKPIKLILGERIELRFQLSDGTYSSSCFTSKIQDIISENEFLITPPDEDNINNWIGRIVNITIPRKDGAYNVQAKIFKEKNENSLVFLQVKILGNYVRKQRREFFRLKITLDVEIVGYGSAKTIDISGNGIAILSEINFEDNEQVKGIIKLNDKVIEFNGVVIRCQDVSDKHNLVCIHLIKLDKETQDTIVKFIYTQQVSMMNKGIPL